MNYSLRLITDSDRPFLKKVYYSTRETELDSIPWTQDEKDKFIEFQFNAQHNYFLSAYKGVEFLIIVVNNSKMGRLYLWKTERQIRIVDIALLPEFRNKGIGTKILNDLIDESESTGTKLTIHVKHDNPALSFYERLGFNQNDDDGLIYYLERIPENGLKQ